MSGLNRWSPKPFIVSSNLTAPAKNYLELWCNWWAREIEALEVVVRIYEAPQIFMEQYDTYKAYIDNDLCNYYSLVNYRCTLVSPLLLESNIYHVNEKYGLLNYSDYVSDKIHKLSSDIDHFLLYVKNKTYDSSVSDIECPLKHFYISNMQLGWINELHVFVSDIDTTNGSDAFILNDQYIAKYGNKSYCCYQKNNNKIIYGSIVLFGYDPDYSTESRILHELKHLFDTCLPNQNIYKINSDIETCSKILFSEDDYKLMQKVFSIRDIKALKTFIKNISEENLFTIFSYNIYLLNKSELQARLEQVKEDVRRIKDIPKQLNKGLLHSYVYVQYLTIYKLYNNLVLYTDNKVKEKFVKSNEFNYIITQVYKDNKKLFKILSYNNYIKQFDSFIMYFAEEIYNKFLRHSASMMINL